ncbi:hypothetical protein GCM10023195_18240 [Actinoallomurus liliacearum]|uniref:Peptidase S11 D-alanyl-D-alanine carboxypeptidase A N-terminal domain-containing protein n=1 Tax=Actinoallomurus liliacearum TaxID=1080073 RepID=A0ABP8TDD1_9ACTN
MSREPDDARNEAAGTPQREDPGPGTEPQEEPDTGSAGVADADAESGAPASGQEDSAEPVRASEPESEATAELGRPAAAFSGETAEKDETDADAVAEQRDDHEAPEPSAESAETGDAEAGEQPAAGEDEPLEVEADDDTAVSADARSEQADEPEGPEPGDEPEVEHDPEPEDEHKVEPEDEPGPEDESEYGDEPEPDPGHGPSVDERDGADREKGSTPTAEFQLPRTVRVPAVSSDLTVMDMPRPTVPRERPRPERSVFEPAPRPSSGGTREETEPTAPPRDRGANTALTRPAPDREGSAPGTEAPGWFAPAQGPSSYASPTAPRTVEEPLPVRRPPTRGSLADTTQRDGLPMPTRLPAPAAGPPAPAPVPAPAPAPLPAPTAAYAPLPPPALPSPAAAPPQAVRPPAAEAPAQAPEAEPRRKRRRTGWIVAVALLVLLALVVTGQLVRPTPRPTLRLTLAATRHTFDGAAPDLPWPQQGQATLYVDGLGTMGSFGGQTPIPTASVAKVMTAYVFLNDHPLASGTDGPTYRISSEEAAQLPARKERGESLVEVVAGQAFTERKALEALLLVSANNIAHELARWDVGDEQAFVAKMNATARSLGMTGTTYTDPSGYDSTTVSTAADQVKLLTAAMRIPAFAEVVNHHTYVPNDGRPSRTAGNALLGRFGVVGGKTGYTDAAGGNFVFAVRKRKGSVTTTIVGAVMGQRSPSAMGAIEAAQPLIIAAEQALTSVTLARTGAEVALVDDGLGGHTPLRATAPVTVVGWGGLTVPVRVTGAPPRQASAGARVGVVKAGAAATPLVADQGLKPPSLLKRLLRLA